MANIRNANRDQLEMGKVKAFENQFDDVMELIDTTEIKKKLEEAESQFQKDPSEVSKIRLGLIFHETALNLSFKSKNEYKGYAKKSYDLLSELYSSLKTTNEGMPLVASFRASALSLVVAETKKLKLLDEAFKQFKDAINKYADISYLPEYLRGSVAENLPWFFFTKKAVSKNDFQSIISKHEKNKEYANWKIMSFTYWAWAKQRQGRKYRNQAINYLDKAINLDPDYKAGRTKAESLKLKLTK